MYDFFQPLPKIYSHQVIAAEQWLPTGSQHATAIGQVIIFHNDITIF